jgi:predicted DCC family thiol-disulfide oxidoreductase YuxK
MTSPKLQPVGSHLILYDGVCGLCNRFVSFVLKHDTKAQFRFASLQSARGQSLVWRYKRSTQDLDTVYVVTNYDAGPTEMLERARAGLFVLKALGGPWRWAGILGFLPNALLDFGYDCIARYRYRIFGKYDRCMLPSAEHRERFIDV